MQQQFYGSFRDNIFFGITTIVSEGRCASKAALNPSHCPSYNEEDRSDGALLELITLVRANCQPFLVVAFDLRRLKHKKLCVRVTRQVESAMRKDGLG